VGRAKLIGFQFKTGFSSWREIIGRTLRDSGLRPRVEIDGANGPEPWMEILLWRNGARCCLALLKNAMELLESADSADGKAQQSKELTIRLNFPARNVRNVRTGKAFGAAQTFKDQLVPWEANLYEFDLAK
jgi:hypothetical protein